MESHAADRPALTASLDRTTQYGLIILAVIQGYALYFLHLSLDKEVWPATDLPWLKALYTLAVGLPGFLYLGMDRIRHVGNLVAVPVLVPLLFFLGWHLGWVESVQGIAQNRLHRFTPAFIMAMSVSLFILAFYFRAWTESDAFRFPTHRLITLSWEQALTLAFLGLFVLAFWLLLILWAGLFKAIEIDFFADLFKEPAFIYPVTGLVIGFGLVLIRHRIRWVANVEFMCEALIKALLPLASGIILLFFVALLITGLQPIWDTGSAAVLMMTLTLVLLFKFNAVFGSTDQAPYPVPVRALVFLAIASLPIGTALAGWALWLRIDQYGLTLDRLWAALIQLLTAAFTLSYTGLILWRRFDALAGIRRLNKGLAFVVAGALVLVNTPMADFRAWAAESQADRLLSGDVDVETFDYAYMRFSLGQYGVQTLESIRRSEFAERNPIVEQRIATVMKQKSRWSRDSLVESDDTEAAVAMLGDRETNADLPAELVRHWIDDQKNCFSGQYHCVAVPIRSADPIRQWALFRRSNQMDVWFAGTVYLQIEGVWTQMGSLRKAHCDGEDDKKTIPVPQALVPIEGPLVAFKDQHCLQYLNPSPEYVRSVYPG